MDNYAAPARPIVEAMTQAALAQPARTVAFQGAPGANSHVAAIEAFPDGLPLPCFDFADALEAVKSGKADPMGALYNPVRFRARVCGIAPEWPDHPSETCVTPRCVTWHRGCSGGTHYRRN